jgi:hypothetical protein
LKGERSHIDAARAERAFCIILRRCTVLGDMAALIKAFSDSFA